MRMIALCMSTAFLTLALLAQPAQKKGAPMEKVVTGDFEVKLAPVDETAPFSRMTIDKQFTGALTAASKGVMVAFMTAVKGSAGYVAMEQVTGSLEGREGTFVLQHSSTMERGVGKQSIVVVPDSGTGALAGLSGSMVIEMEGGKHGYRFTYRLPEAAPRQ
jgi:hypothetical protein